MDEVLQKAIEGLLNTVNQAGDFVIEQAPEVIQQWITFTTVYSALSIVANVGALVICYLTVFKWVDQDTYRGEWSVGKQCSGVVGGIVSSFCVTSIIFNTHKLLLVTIAPKVFILQEASNLVR
jgi:hypothetical protein